MTTTVSTPSVMDTRTDDFRAVLSNFKLFKNEEGSHWTFAGDTSLTNLDTSMQVTLQHSSHSHVGRGMGETPMTIGGESVVMDTASVEQEPDHIDKEIMRTEKKSMLGEV